MPPMQENSPTAVATAFSDGVSEEITISLPSNEPGKKGEREREGAGKTSTALASPLGLTDHAAQW